VDERESVHVDELEDAGVDDPYDIGLAYTNSHKGELKI